MFSTFVSNLVGKASKDLEKEYALIEEKASNEVAEKEKEVAKLKEQLASNSTLFTAKGALDAVSSAIMMIDRDFIVTYANDATKKLFSENKEEFKKAFPNFDPAKIMGTCIDVFHRTPSHQRQLLADTSRLPYRTQIKVGTLNVMLYVTACKDEAGNCVGNTLEWRDVSAEMDASGQLAAIDKMQGVIEFDLDGNILNVNENFAAVTGYSKSEIIGGHHSMFLDSDYAKSEEYKKFWIDLGAGEAQISKFRRVGKGGKEVWLQASYNPIVDMNGKTFKVVKHAIDITESVALEKENNKKAAEALLIKNTLDSASINMMMADIDGVIRYMNPSAAKLMEVSATEFRKVLPHFDPSKIIDQNFDIFHKNPSHQRNMLANLKDTHIATLPIGGLWFKLSANPIYKSDGSRLGTAVEWLDITKERKVEEDISQVIEAASTGDMSNRLETEGQPEATAKILDGINSLLNRITGIIDQVKEAGETINTAAGEISTGNNDLSSRTEEQASNLEETASSMEELASTVKHNAENSKQANQLAASASEVAVKGGEVVGEVVDTMNAINQSSQKIEEIISVIDGIAFQTNILALNAAVEAARAGEQGRGFAVVAGEVRNLAQRSAGAAKEIKELITDSVAKTSEGTKLVENAGATMDEIVSSVKSVTDIMGEISAASSEQSAGIDQVNQAVTSMDEATQQNAALVEEAAAAAESLVDQSQSLMRTVNEFKLPKGVNHERRAINSAMRSSASKTRTQKTATKTGTDGNSLEEF